jgi:hypothetical protein
MGVGDMILSILVSIATVIIALWIYTTWFRGRI